MKQPIVKDLINRTHSVISELEHFQTLETEVLNWKASPDTWSILECIEHLIYYSDFYLPEFQKRLKGARKFQPDTPFKSSWLGDYFAKMMLPDEKGKKISTFKSMNPNGKALSRDRIDYFLDQQRTTLNILKQADEADLRKTKSSITLASWLKLRLGDALRVVIYHNERHILQAKRCEESFVK